MKNKLKSVRRSSKTAAPSQLKTSQSRADSRPTSPSPSIVLFLERDGGVNEEGIDLSVAEYAALKRAAAPTGDGILMFMANAALEKVGESGALPVKRGAKQPSCFCFYDGGVGELAGEIPLVGRELGSVVIAACQKRITVDQFIADAIKEKLTKSGDKAPSPSRPIPEAGLETAHDRLSGIVSEALAIIDILSDSYNRAIDNDNEARRMRTEGITWLAYGVTNRLGEQLPLAMSEWIEATRAAQPNAERRAA
jgi:hypothetical protein